MVVSSFISNLFADYVFVDEHNRHRRLKGKTPFAQWNLIEGLIFLSYEGL